MNDCALHLAWPQVVVVSGDASRGGCCSDVKEHLWQVFTIVAVGHAFIAVRSSQ